MGGGRVSTRGLVVTVVAGGMAAVAAVFATFPSAPTRAIIPRALALIALTAAGEMIAIRLAHGSESELITLTEAAVVADLVLLPPAIAVVCALAGCGLALLLQRRSPVKLIFNLGQYALGIVAAAILYHGPGKGAFETGRGLAFLALGATAFTAVNLITISAILAVTQSRRFIDVIIQERGLSLALGVGCSSLGIVAVAAYISRPLLLPFVLAPALAMHLAFRGWVKQKELSSNMEAEKAKLERVLEHSSEGIVLIGHDGNVVLWSPAMERTTGVPAAEAVGKRIAFLLRGRGLRGQAIAVEASSSSDAVEFELITPTGDVRWLRVQHGPGLGPDGTLAFDVLVVTDVTRTREVESLKSNFIATVSHELRTPLTPIKGFASLLLRRGDQLPAEHRREALQTIIDRSDHMVRLVEDLLLASTMSREGERRLPEVQRQTVDVAALLDKTLRSFRRAHPLREFQIEQSERLNVFADPLRAEQMIANLISNAVKFSDEGTPVTVAAASEGAMARIDVRDEGRGIPAGMQDVIFERFKRLEDPLRMETGGAGLGLFIAQQLSRAMDGDISVQSTPGQGSTFTVRIPLLQKGESAGAEVVRVG